MLQLGNDVVEEVEEGGNEPSEDEDDLVDMVLQSPLDQYLDPMLASPVAAVGVRTLSEEREYDVHGHS